MMEALKTSLVKGVIYAANRTSVGGVGGYGAGKSGAMDRFAPCRIEKLCANEIFDTFPALDMTGRDVLDFGCGYGGKTVEFGRKAKRVVGIEPFRNMIEIAAAYAASENAPNVDFRVCTQDNIPCEDQSFDIIISHDVLEHVDNPATSLSEMHRVLRPGGLAFIIFPPYDGALSHHLDYVTRMPALHWVFAPGTLVRAVNLILQTDTRERFGTKLQPEPRQSWDGSRPVLPGLNGLTSAQFRALAKDLFSVAEAENCLIGHSRSNTLKRLAHMGSTWLVGLGFLDQATGKVIGVLQR